MLKAGKRLSQDRLQIIFESLNPEYKDELIEGHMRLCGYIIGKFSYYSSHLKDEIEGVGYLNLVQAVEDIVTRKVKMCNVEHIPNYIGRTITQRLIDVLSAPMVLNMSSRTVRWQMKHGINFEKRLHPAAKNYPEDKKKLLMLLPIEYQEKFLYNVNEEAIKNELRKLIKTTVQYQIEEDYPDDDEPTPPYGTYVPIARQTEPSPDFLELIKKSITSPLQEAIINLRMQGYTYEEIGPKVGLSHVMVHRHVVRAEERFNEISGTNKIKKRTKK